jgi:hypothetical protein
MAALLPFLQDLLLPMIMPSSIHIAKAGDITPQPKEVQEKVLAEDRGTIGVNGKKKEIRVITRDAIINKTDKMCATGK